MTIFTRNDKTPDSAATASAPQEVPVQVNPEIKRAQAPARPISNLGTSQTPMASVISKALKITGQLESTEDIQIDGEVEGDVRAVFVRVGGNAKVKGTVYGEKVELAGTVDGRIEAKKVIL